MMPLDPVLTRRQMRTLDRLAIEELGIPGVVLMENAGRGAAEVIRDRVDRTGAERVVILCGRGNNGGDGWVIARHLFNHRVAVRSYLIAEPSSLRGDAAINYRIVRNMGLEIETVVAPERIAAVTGGLTPRDLVVDALLGTGFSGTVRPPLEQVIQAVNAASTAAVVSVDIPSGLDCDTGLPGGVAIRADLTLTFVARKRGFSASGADRWTGEVRVLGIGTPDSLRDRVLSENVP